MVKRSEIHCSLLDDDKTSFPWLLASLINDQEWSKLIWEYLNQQIAIKWWYQHEKASETTKTTKWPKQFESSNCSMSARAHSLSVRTISSWDFWNQIFLISKTLWAHRRYVEPPWTHWSPSGWPKRGFSHDFLPFGFDQSLNLGFDE